MLCAPQLQSQPSAAGNTAGAAVGFMGMGMAAGAGGMNAQSIFGQADGGVPQSQYPMAAGGGFATPGAPTGAPAGADAGEWTCSCGATSTGKF